MLRIDHLWPLFFIHLLPLVQSNCPPIQPPENGRIFGACLTRPDSRCFLQCNNDETLYTRMCTEQGNWTGEQLICDANSTDVDAGRHRRCSRRLRSPSFGYIIGKCGRNHGSSCRFGCYSGYTLVGKWQVNCTEGKWSSKEPRCLRSTYRGEKERTCQRINLPRNAVKEGSCGNGAKPNSTCIVHCYEREFVQRSTSLLCLPNGEWYGSLPRCKRQLGTFASFPSGASSMRPPTMGGMYPQVGGMYPQMGGMYPQMGGMYPQMGGVRPPTMSGMMPPTMSGMMPPTMSGMMPPTMSGMMPSTSMSTAATRQCIGLTPPVNGLSIGACNPGIANTVCTFLCNRGFFLVGTPILTCMSNGQWSSSVPICHRDSGCRLPRTASNVVITQCNSLVGGRCYYRCRTEISRWTRTVSASSVRDWISGLFNRSRRTTTTTTTTPSSSANSSDSNVYATVRYSECQKNRTWSKPFRCPSTRRSNG